MVKVTKFKSANLLGETRKQEKLRLSKQIRDAIILGRSPTEIRKISSLKGASPSMLRKRRLSLAKSGLKGQKAPTIKERLRFL